MCSTNGGQLGRICRAIDELAASSAGADVAAGGAAQAAREGGTAAAAGSTAAAKGSTAAREGSMPGAGAAPPGGRDDADIARLAAIWEMVADADPELAKRLPGYLSATE
jgi:hypothetical protein